MSKVPLAGSITDRKTQNSSQDDSHRKHISFAFNCCCLCECCCPGYAIVVGSIILAGVELGVQVIFLTYPLLILTKFFPGFYENAEIDDTKLDLDFRSSESGSQSSPSKQAVIYGGTPVFGEIQYFVGIKYNNDIDKNKSRITAAEAAEEVQLKPAGLTAEEVQTLSQMTIFIPLAICIITIIGACTLIIGCLIRNRSVCVASSVVHLIVASTTVFYVSFISHSIHTMFDALDQDGITSIGTKFSYTYQLWIELLYFIVFFPLSLAATLNGIGLFLRFSYPKKSSNAKSTSFRASAEVEGGGKTKESAIPLEALHPSARRNTVSIPIVPYLGPRLSYSGGPPGIPPPRPPPPYWNEPIFEPEPVTGPRPRLSQGRHSSQPRPGPTRLPHRESSTRPAITTT